MQTDVSRLKQNCRIFWVNTLLRFVRCLSEFYYVDNSRLVYRTLSTIQFKHLIVPCTYVDWFTNTLLILASNMINTSSISLEIYKYYIILNLRVSVHVSHMRSVLYVKIITIIFFTIIYMYNMPSPTHVHVYVWSVVYICKYCVCPNRPYGLLDFEIKLCLSYVFIFSAIFWKRTLHRFATTIFERYNFF